MMGTVQGRACAVWLAAVVAAGCGDDPACIEGVCPDFDESRSLPGPCRAGLVDSPALMTFEYDAAGRVTRAGRLYPLRDDRPPVTFMGAEWRYDAAGRPSQILESIQESLSPGQPYTWSFGAQDVSKSGRGLLMRYDPAAFAFMPLVGRALARPDAELGLLQLAVMGGDRPFDRSYEWEVVGSRRIRRQIPDGGPGPFDTRTFELDEQGRIVSIASDVESDGVVESTSVLTYDGARLIARDDMAWTYDLGGNVVEGRSADSNYREVYAYDCW